MFSHRSRIVSALAVLLGVSIAGAQDAAPARTAGEAALPCVSDTYIACYPIGIRSLTVKGSEQGANAGKSKKLKIKKFEAMPILKFDFAQVPAKSTITSASVEVQIVNDRPLNHVGVASLHVDWNEGEGTYGDSGPIDLNHTGANFLGPKGPQTRWRNYEDGDFNKATAGIGGNATCVNRAKNLGNGRWSIPVDPYVVQAAIENGQTLVLTDETGLFEGQQSNAFIASREAGDKGPVLMVHWAAEQDTVKPAFDGQTTVEPGPFAGSVVVRLAHAGDDADKGDALGYRVTIDGKEIDRVDIPRPRRVQRGMLVRDLPAGKAVDVVVTAFDEAGNTATQTIRGNTQEAFAGKLLEAAPLPKIKMAAAQTNDAFSLKVIDGSTLVDPVTAKLAPRQLRSQAQDDVPASLSIVPAVRGEFVGLQALVEPKGDAKLDGLTIEASDFTGDAGAISAKNVEFFREHYVKMQDAWIADVLPTLAAGDTVGIPSQKNLDGQKLLGVYIDLLVPKETAPGIYTGTITVKNAAGAATWPLAIDVRDVTLPDELGFVIEMNAYGHSNDVKVFHETYRLLHKHRLSYNVLGYGHSGSKAITAPVLNSDKDPSIKGKDVKIVDWSKYDEFYGPLFSGEIAKDLPRKGVPATHWYLPFHDSWPTLLEESHPELWKGRVAPQKDKAKFGDWVNMLAANDPLIGEHFSDNWKAATQSVGAEFREHFAKNGWSKPAMQVFNNHKYYFASGSLSLWTMDEPQYGRDFRALNWMYTFQRDAIQGQGINTEVRADVSRPELMGDRMDDSLDLMVVSSAIDHHPHLIEDTLATVKGSELWWYGGGSGANADPLSYDALFLARWSLGADGGMPVYTVLSGPNDWDKTDPLRVVRYDDKGMPVASFRMKAYRQGQQDMELLQLLAKKPGFNRWHLRDLLREVFPIKMVTVSKNPDDPGYTSFENLDTTKIDDLRERVITTLLAK